MRGILRPEFHELLGAYQEAAGLRSSQGARRTTEMRSCLFIPVSQAKNSVTANQVQDRKTPQYWGAKRGEISSMPRSPHELSRSRICSGPSISNTTTFDIAYSPCFVASLIADVLCSANQNGVSDQALCCAGLFSELFGVAKRGDASGSPSRSGLRHRDRPVRGNPIRSAVGGS